MSDRRRRNQRRKRGKNTARGRPAETLTLAGAAGFLLGRAFGLDDPETMTALTMVVAFIPAAVTWVVELFGGGTEEDETDAPVPLSGIAAELSETAASALKKARDGRPWEEDAKALREISEVLSRAQSLREL